MSWQTCDLYVCVNAECKSKILVLQPSRAAPRAPVAPSCVCGHRLERAPYGVGDPLRAWSS